MEDQIDPKILIEELKAQRNALADQLAIAGALITQYRNKEKDNQEATPINQ